MSDHQCPVCGKPPSDAGFYLIIQRVCRCWGELVIDSTYEPIPTFLFHDDCMEVKLS